MIGVVAAPTVAGAKNGSVLLGTLSAGDSYKPEAPAVRGACIYSDEPLSTRESQISASMEHGGQKKSTFTVQFVVAWLLSGLAAIISPKRRRPTVPCQP